MNGSDLRALREGAGVTLRTLADAVGRDVGHLSRVERGHRDPTPALVAAYQDALRGTLEDMERRRLLAAGAAAAGLALTDALPALVAGDAAPVRVGLAEVAAIRSLALDFDLGSPFALHVAEAALQRAAALLHAQVRPEVAPSLHAAVALLADRVGWAQLEAGRDPFGTLAFAQRTAARGDDADLHAHALLDLAVSTVDPRVAVATLEHGLSGPVAGAERVNLHAVAARLAAKYDRKAAVEHLAQALDTQPTAGGSEWAQRMTAAPGHLDAIAGFACYAVGHEQAGERLAGALVQFGEEGRQRTRARCHVRLAGLALVVGDEDGGGAHLRRALSLRRSTLVGHDLRALASVARSAGRDDLARLAVQAPREQ